jgi:hypothetical protein
MDGAGTESVLLTTLTNAPVGVTAAYDLSGAGSGALLADVDQTSPSNAATQYLFGSNFSTSSCSIEAVFRPDDHVGPEPIWGSGGNGTGSSLVLIDDQLIYTACGGANVVQAIATIPANALAGGDYVHVIATLDLDLDIASIYVNGVLINTGTAVNIQSGAAGNMTDWSGTDDEGIGRSAGTTGGDTATAPGLGVFGTVDIPDFNDANDRFDGELAIVRVYASALAPAEVTANFESVFGTITTSLGLAALADVAGTANPASGMVIDLPSGARVTVEDDGSLTYDANGAFDHVGVGLTEVDTFTYTVNGGGLNSTATVKVTINGSNADPQIEIAADSADVSEGTPAGFTLSSTAALASPVTVNLSYSGAAADGDDFTGTASVVLSAGGTPSDLDLPTIMDSLFEGDELLTVTIDSVTGSAVRGANTSATLTILDSDPTPEFSIAGPVGAVTEGALATFTITATNAAVSDSTIDLLFTGSAGINDSYRFATATVVGGQTTATVEVPTFDDGHTEGAETIQVTLTATTLGVIGASNTATAMLTDGSAEAVFFSDFEGVTAADTPGGTALNTDAPAAANAGTSIGAWLNVLTASTGGAAPGLIAEQDDARGDGIDTMLRIDRPGTPAEGELSAVFSSPLDISGANTGSISFDIAQLRTLTPDKDSRIIGLDGSGDKSFELLISGDNAGPTGKSLFHVDSLGVLTQLSDFNTLPNTQDYGNAGNNESGHANIRLDLTSSGYAVTLDHPVLNVAGIDGIADVTTGSLAYAGGAATVSRILFQMSGDADINISSGLLFDNVTAAGVRGQQSVLEAWRSAYFGSPANSGPGADNNDANDNGLTNLLDFAFGFDPVARGPRSELLLDDQGNITQLGGPTIWQDPNDGSFHIRFTRRVDFALSELLYVAETSLDLTGWVEAPAATVIGTGTGAGGVAIEAMQAPLPAGARDAQARIRVLID